jgi:hypothetical protein
LTSDKPSRPVTCSGRLGLGHPNAIQRLGSEPIGSACRHTGSPALRNHGNDFVQRCSQRAHADACLAATHALDDLRRLDRCALPGLVPALSCERVLRFERDRSLACDCTPSCTDRDLRAICGCHGLPAAVTRPCIATPVGNTALLVPEEVDQDGFDSGMLGLHDLRLFSPAATAPDASLLRGVKVNAGDTVSAFLAQKNVSLLRTIGTDDQLAFALVHELELRGLRARPSSGLMARCPQQGEESSSGASHKHLPSSIAIVSEWDTLYGRSLRQQFRYDPSTDKPGFCVTRWHYLRGLDGRLPGDNPALGADSGTKKDSKSEQKEAVARDGGFIERPEGQSQYDYLSRLATSIREEDARLRRLYGREHGIRAIGVLGNDVYDKLLVLQALQGELPHAIFFTTDLDARMLHAREQAWARNLIVASNFGLRLSEPLQRGFAPFRDSYQPSAYLSTLLAMADVGQAIDWDSKHKGAADPARMSRPRWTQTKLNEWFDKPRLFEISRTGAFDFSDASVAVPAPVASAPVDAVRCGRWRLEPPHALHRYVDLLPFHRAFAHLACAQYLLRRVVQPTQSDAAGGAQLHDRAVVRTCAAAGGRVVAAQCP